MSSQEISSPPPSSSKIPRIEVRSYEVANILGAPAVHHEIVFIIDEKLQIALNGMAHDRSTGESKATSLSGKDTLQVTGGNSLKDAGLKLIASATVYEGSLSEVYERLAKASEAANYINKNNLDYVIVGGPFSHAQNSNSVAHTLVKAMGLTYPPEIENLWAPGHERILIPNNWKSAFNNSAQVFFGEDGEKIRDHFFKLLAELEPAKVKESVLKSPKPNVNPDAEHSGGYMPVFFNPKTAPENFTLPQNSLQTAGNKQPDLQPS